MSAFAGRVEVGGKLMLAGEYSVLGAGGSAIAVAISPGLAVRVSDATKWTVAREDLGIQHPVGSGEPPESLRFASLAVDAVLAAYPELRDCPAVVTYEANAAYGSGTSKPGVGGSASATVAAMVATLRRLERPVSAEELIPLAIQVHRDAQGGRGSGYDIATIAHGGLVEYRPVQLAGGAGPLVESSRIPWPSGLRLVAGYTGQSASTTALLKRLEARAESDRAGTVRALQSLGAPVGQLAESLQDGSFTLIRDAVATCHHALERFDLECSLGVMTPKVTEMIDLATQVGAAAKVSGAGGGDSVIALVPNEEMEMAVREAWIRHAYQVLPVEVSMNSPVLA